MYRVIIAGDRNWDDFELDLKMRSLLLQMPKNVEILHGACRGVDQTADRIARELGFKVTPYPANWDEYGRAAGPIRNKQMLDTGPVAVYLFHKSISTSKGTKNMMDQTIKRRIPFVLID